jgi:hypothetical protein
MLHGLIRTMTWLVVAALIGLSVMQRRPEPNQGLRHD